MYIYVMNGGLIEITLQRNTPVVLYTENSHRALDSCNQRESKLYDLFCSVFLSFLSFQKQLSWEVNRNLI